MLRASEAKEKNSFSEDSVWADKCGRSAGLWPAATWQHQPCRI